MVAFGVAELTALRDARWMRRVVGGASLVLLTACGAMTWHLTHYWRDSLVLFTRAVQVTDQNPVAEYYLAEALMEVGRSREGAEHFRHVVALRPTYAIAYANLGKALEVIPDLHGAEQAYRDGLKVAPDRAFLWTALGAVLNLRGRRDEASAAYERARQLSAAGGHSR